MAVPLPTLHLRVNGDLTLLVGEHGQRFVVSRDTMCGACPVWERMLNGPYAEATNPEIAFPDDDPKVLHILLSITHLTFKNLPPTLTLEELTTLAFMCDKYDTVALVRPFLPTWTEPWLKAGSYLDRGNEEWVWISYVFGYEEEFCARVKQLVQDMRISQGGTPCVSVRRGKTALEDLLPEGLSESLLKMRHDTVTEVLKMCYELIETLESANACSHQDSANYQICGDLMLGSLIRTWSPLDHFKSSHQATAYRHSLRALGRTIRAVPTRSRDPFAEPDILGSKRGRGGNSKHNFDHSGCDAEIRAKLLQIETCILNVESPVQVSHLCRIREQAEKGRFA
ncbi:V-type proton ATPase subunit D [Venturia nashicola]|uniref:V-type proton ATPase subunit D n=1 Tax=Venturia nashicola TaxID=86259 RepID=A0A4Z1PPI2_9PEZI|nr:V-type proton ATPase subunit D [Venturia nashicola]TLD37924.1 V-type proton ATPase subunit D [Venturia nashicola]